MTKKKDSMKKGVKGNMTLKARQLKTKEVIKNSHRKVTHSVKESYLPVHRLFQTYN